MPDIATLFVQGGISIHVNLTFLIYHNLLSIVGKKKKKRQQENQAVMNLRSLNRKYNGVTNLPERLKF